MTKTIKVLCAAGVAMAMAACGGGEPPVTETEEPAADASTMASMADPDMEYDAKPSAVDRFMDVEWRLVAIGGEPVPDNIVTTIRFEGDGKYGGQGPCNRYFGELNSAEGGPIFGAAGATRMACPEPQMALETRYFEALAAVTSMSMSGMSGEDMGPLTFQWTRGDESGELVFEMAPPAAEE